VSEPRVSKEKVVYFTYVIRDDAGEEMERSDLPVGYVHGIGGKLLPKLEEALEGSAAGDSVEIVLEPADGFGEHDPHLTFTDDLENVPEPFRHIGAQAEFRNDHGDLKTFTVTRIENGRLTLDGNHPFAGKAMHYRAKIVEVRDARPEELASGVPAKADGPVIH
jgi:FKBP-type peptidyl-prolyl cis-trans isomerase SlyD